jgi:hypothetical protein
VTDEDDKRARIEAALARLGEEHQPPVGWEARVLAATGATRRRPWWMYAAPGLTLAAAAVVVLILVRPSPQVVALKVEVKHSALFRGDEASAGDTAHITASGRAIWVYHEEVELVLRCPEAPSCQASGGSITLDLPLTRTGTYTVVALGAVPAQTRLEGNYDADTAAAKDAGVEIRQYQLVVR